ncbi:MAG TPA: ABC transporter substrate-binding protein [Candidatus Micrarchaeia archaeon]|nr:ABC transporter substrate-binding protein [Candidatus Micrarchaeia archaeon]
MRRAARAGGLAAVVLVVAACAGSATGTRSTLLARPVAGGIARFALPPAVTPTYIYPLYPFADYTYANQSFFEALMYRPLYAFGDNGSPLLNQRASLADPPVFSNRGRTVTITLKPRRWSDGHPLTTRDVQFWENLLSANKANFGPYVPHNYPDNVVSASYPTPTRFSLTFDRAYNHFWLLYNELSQITPMPQHAWDRTSFTGPVGSFDRTKAGAIAVNKFLSHQATQLSSYGRNPLWKVVDGPWRLSAYTPATGTSVFSANRQYRGSDRPHLSRFEEVPFTSDAAEFNALRAGTIDYGYLPIFDLGQRRYFETHGYRVAAWPLWAFDNITLNFGSPKLRPVLSQLYVRQALQRLVDQPSYIRNLFHGYAVPTYGPVPQQPPTPFVSAQERHNLYPFSVAAARALLSDHGWRVVPNGRSVCRRPGAGPRECGAGVAAGTVLSLDFEYPSGSVVATQEAQAYKSAASAAGIQIQLASLPLNTINSQGDYCPGAGCKFALLSYGLVGWDYGPDYYPSGGQIIGTGAGGNSGAYSNPINDRNITATHVDSGLAPLYRYQNFVQAHLPLLFFPTPVFQISVIRNTLQGIGPQSPLTTIAPQTWYRTG